MIGAQRAHAAAALTTLAQLMARPALFAAELYTGKMLLPPGCCEGNGQWVSYKSFGDAVIRHRTTSMMMVLQTLHE